MNDTSRRKFLAAAAAGAGAVAGTVALPIAHAAAGTPRDRRGRAKEPVVAWIEDPNADELVLMSGDREVVVRDRDLVSRILLATGAE